GTTRVIVTVTDDLSQAQVLDAIKKLGGKARRALRSAGAVSAELPNDAIAKLAANPNVGRIVLDRPVVATMERTGATIGSTAVRQTMGIDGTGVGVAIIDSGVTSWHDDLGGGGSAQRVDAFVDFVNARATPYDDFGHGTHVAGIVAGNGFDSSGARTGVAP